MQVSVPQVNPLPRVALATGSLNLGGATTYLCNLGGELARRGCPLFVSSFEPENPLGADLAQRGIQSATHDPQGVIIEDQLDRVLGEFRAFAPDVAIAWLGPVAFETLRYLPPGVARIGAAHSDHPVVYELIARFAGHLDGVVGVSQHIVDTLAQSPALARVPLAKVVSGVAVPAVVPARQPLAGAPLRILYFGRLEREQKRAHLFPQILAGLRESGAPFTWTIAGDGSERGALEQAMAGGAPGQIVRFVGTVEYAAVPALLAEHDVFLLASDHEGLPLSLLEAMGHGLAPVVSDLASGVREVVDDENGMLVPPDDVDGYARAILRLHERRDLLAALAASARARVRTGFSVAAMADQWLAFIDRVRPRAATPAWPRAFNIQPLLGAPRAWRFRQPARALRRLVKSCGWPRW